jgi:putative endonuclease
MTNKLNTVIYTGVTSNLSKRVYEHQNHLVEGFTKRYNLTKFVYYESFDSIADAIVREKQIKGGSRKKKMNLILSLNPQFLDLSGQL